MILPTITTTKPNWKSKIKEVEKLGIKELAFFLTCLDLTERKEFYKLAEEAKIKNVPFVHIREDMDLKELDYLVRNYKTKVFNIHTQLDFPLIYDYSKYKNIIYIENSPAFPFQEKELKDFAGICLDVTHLENDWLTNKNKFEREIKILEKYPIGCNHISAIKDEIYKDEKGVIRYDAHSFEELSEFNYLKKYPKKYFSSLMALELENTLEEQMKVKDYILHENFC